MDKQDPLLAGLTSMPVPLFQGDQKAAIHPNFVLDSAAAYTARQRGPAAKNQNLRDKGHLSEQEDDNLISKSEMRIV